MWAASPPAEARRLGVRDYLRDVFVDANFYVYYYSSTRDISERYASEYHKQPFISQFVKWKWALGQAVTPEQHQEAMRRLEVYKKWFVSRFLRHEVDNALLILPISDRIRSAHCLAHYRYARHCRSHWRVFIRVESQRPHGILACCCQRGGTSRHGSEPDQCCPSLSRELGPTDESPDWI
jgi:hypothetical protein